MRTSGRAASGPNRAQHVADAGDERRKRGSPFLDRTLTEILTVEV